MKATKKNIFGLSGLFLVAAITTFAVLMPELGANATSGLDITHADEITVRVVGDAPALRFSGVESGSTLSTPEAKLKVDYENVGKLRVEVEYTDTNGEVHTYVIDEYDTGGEVGSRDVLLKLKEDPRFGYGHYKVRATAERDGVQNAVEDVIEFTYSPIAPDVSGGTTGGNDGQTSKPGSSPDNPLTGDIVVKPGIDANDSSIGRVEVNVYDEDGKPVEGLSPQVFYPPFGDFVLPFSDYPLTSGKYRIEMQAYDQNGNKIGEPWSYEFYYQADEMPVPDTGAPFANLNISRQDYLLTGLIVFTLTAVLGAVLIVRRKKDTQKRRH